MLLPLASRGDGKLQSGSALSIVSSTVEPASSAADWAPASHLRFRSTATSVFVVFSDSRTWNRTKARTNSDLY